MSLLLLIISELAIFNFEIFVFVLHEAIQYNFGKKLKKFGEIVHVGMNTICSCFNRWKHTPLPMLRFTTLYTYFSSGRATNGLTEACAAGSNTAEWHAKVAHGYRTRDSPLRNNLRRRACHLGYINQCNHIREEKSEKNEKKKWGNNTYIHLYTYKYIP